MSNLISAQVTDETVATTKAKIVEINELLPFLVALSSAEKQRRRVMGQKSVEYVNLALRGEVTVLILVAATIMRRRA